MPEIELNLEPLPTHVLTEMDIRRIFNRTGRKHLVRVDGFTGSKRTQRIGKVIKNVGGAIIEFLDTPSAVFYSVGKIKY